MIKTCASQPSNVLIIKPKHQKKHATKQGPDADAEGLPPARLHHSQR